MTWSPQPGSGGGPDAEPRPPVESPYSDVDASRIAEYLGVPICVREVNDPQSATSTQHPHGLIQSLSAPLGPAMLWIVRLLTTTSNGADRNGRSPVSVE